MTTQFSARAWAQALDMSTMTGWRWRQYAIARDDPDATHALGLDGRVRPIRRTDTTERDARIRELRAERQSMRAIADAIECSVGTVHRVLAK